MIIISKDRSAIINSDHVSIFGIGGCKKLIFAHVGESRIVIGRYEDEEVTTRVFRQIFESIARKNNYFYMPE